jgi:subtilisin family serine protease
MDRRLIGVGTLALSLACGSADDGAREDDRLAVTSEAITIPDDPLFSLQWGLRNTGQLVPWTTPDEDFLVAGTAGVDINLPLAWDVTQGASDVIVGILELSDSDVYHEDLADNVYRNRDETPGDGIDNDGNGCIDDDRGCDFIDQDGVASPVFGHATHVSAIVAGRFQNDKGIAGVAPKIKFLPLTASAQDGTIIQAIQYARSLGVRIVNISQGGVDWFDPAIRDAMASSGILFVCSAGNRGTPRYNYPSSYDLPNVIAVANMTNTGELSVHSNYSDVHVDLAAPGRSVLSAFVGNDYDYLDGTSQAAPHVTGVAALVLKRFPNLTAAQLADRLLRTGMRMNSLAGLVKSRAMLDARAALQDVGPVQLTATSTPGSITLSFGAVSGATRYEVERDGVIVNNGTSRTFTHSGLVVDSAHIYRVRAVVGSSVGAFSHRLLAKASRMPTSVSRSIQSPHPYPNDYAPPPFNVTQPGATRLRLHFSRVQTADENDALRYSRSYGDGSDQRDETFTGNYPNGFWTHWVNGDTFQFEFESDSSGNAHGFTVDRIEYF